jgi:hypothetical protein
VTSAHVDEVVVEVEGGPWLRTFTQQLPDLGARAFVVPIPEGSRIEGVTAASADAERGDAILLGDSGAAFLVTAPGFRSGTSCVQITPRSGAAEQLCRPEDAVQLRSLDDRATLLIAGPEEATSWNIQYSNEESDGRASVGRLVNRWLAMPTGIMATSAIPGDAQIERLEAEAPMTGEQLFVATCDRPLPEGSCPVERVGPRPALVRLWQDGPASPLGDVALLFGLAAWVAGLVHAGRRRRWWWFAAILLINVIALVPYALLRLGEARAAR